MNRRFFGIVSVIALSLLTAARYTALGAWQADEIVAAMTAELTRTAVSSAPRDRADLQSLYAANEFRPLWFDGRGVAVSPDVRDALSVIGSAAADGLDPESYDLSQLEAWFADPRKRSAAEMAAADVRLSGALLGYVRHLHEGRVDPRALGLELNLPEEAHDFPGLVWNARAAHRVADIPSLVRPPLVQYRLLREALARYRGLEAFPPVNIAVASLPLRPGATNSAIPALVGLLTITGDVTAGTFSVTSDRYEPGLAGAVRSFQRRHGLADDGVIGAATVAALRVPLEDRVRQIELALERLRWLPDVGGQRLLALNIPMFRMWAWNSVEPDGIPAFAMNAIVGRARITETPVFVSEMRDVVLRPSWNVPDSILRNEILPAMRRDPGYLARHNMELLTLSGGGTRVRQRPGPDNALGLIKFEFPNDDSVYMHGTPAQQLFARSRRDFSHGCVRVEDPVSLAEWALQGTAGWTRERIVATITGTGTVRIRLAQPVQVVLFYTTSAVMPEDGSVWFADDIYGHDGRLNRALTLTMKSAGR